MTDKFVTYDAEVTNPGKFVTYDAEATNPGKFVTYDAEATNPRKWNQMPGMSEGHYDASLQERIVRISPSELGTVGEPPCADGDSGVSDE